jgi:hypothetical protein
VPPKTGFSSGFITFCPDASFVRMEIDQKRKNIPEIIFRNFIMVYPSEPILPPFLRREL